MQIYVICCRFWQFGIIDFRNENVSIDHGRIFLLIFVVHFHLQFLSTKRQIWWNYFYDFYILIISMDYGILLVFVCQLQYSLWACESYWFLDTRKGSIQCYWHDSRQRLVLYNTTTLYINTDVIEYWPIILTKKLLYIYLLLHILLVI